MRDEFNAISFANNNGTANWLGNWQELGETSGPGSGRVQVCASSYCVSGSCLRIGGDEVRITGRGLTRAVNLPGAASATLTFSYRRDYDEEPGSVSLEISSDGGAYWSTLATYVINASDQSPVAQSFDITPFASADTKVRILGSGSEVEGYLYLDNLQIEYSSGTGSTNPSPAPIGTVRDEFNATSFGNNDGTENWLGEWVEIKENDGPNKGDLRVYNNRLMVKDDDKGIQRTVDLSGAVAASMSLQYRRKSLDSSSDYVVLEISNDGGATWSEIDRFMGPGTDRDMIPATYNLSGSAGGHTIIRFITSSNLGDTDKLHIDDLEIGYHFVPDTIFPSQLSADQLHSTGVTGASVTVAVVDTGYWNFHALLNNIDGQARVLAQYNAITDQVEPWTSPDDNGLGSHLSACFSAAYARSMASITALPQRQPGVGQGL